MLVACALCVCAAYPAVQLQPMDSQTATREWNTLRKIIHVGASFGMIGVTMATHNSGKPQDETPFGLAISLYRVSDL